MKTSIDKRTIVIVLTILVAVLVLRFEWLSYIFFLFFILTIPVLFLISVWWLFRKRKLNKVWFKIPLAILYFSLVGIVTDLINPLYSTDFKEEDTLNDKLEVLFTSDREDRMRIKPLLLMTTEYGLPERDRKRYTKVYNWYSKDTIKNPVAKYHAALILQHGKQTYHYKAAYELSLQASEQDVEGAEELSKKAYDRWQISMGKEQKYGTQTQGTIGF